MAWIRTVPEEEATGLLAELYSRALTGSGGVPPLLKAFSLRPDLALARRALADGITLGASGLGRYREELIAVGIAGILRCRF